MTATDTVFAGSIPAIYDQYMVPLVFAPYAKLVAERAAELRPPVLQSVLQSDLHSAFRAQAVFRLAALGA